MYTLKFTLKIDLQFVSLLSPVKIQNQFQNFSVENNHYLYISYLHSSKLPQPNSYETLPQQMPHELIAHIGKI